MAQRSSSSSSQQQQVVSPIRFLRLVLQLSLSLGQYSETFDWYRIRWLTNVKYYEFTISLSGPTQETSGLSSFMLMTNFSVCMAVIKQTSKLGRFSVELQINFPNFDATELDAMDKHSVFLDTSMF